MQRGFRKKIFDIIIFALIFAGFAFILTTIPLLPLGLPLFISFLIAFAAFKSPKNGMTLGCLLVSISLVYHLARMNFIYVLGESEIRFLFVLLFILFFISISSSVERREDTLPISIGMISAGLLFFKQTFCLAIPLILVFATVYKKARLGLALTCYILISLPLQMLQYLNYGSQTERPPLYVPLDKIFVDLQKAMSRFTFNEIFRILGTIYEAVASPNSSLIESINSIGNYLNSFPGMVVFFLILSGLISATAFATSYLASFLKQIRAIKKYRDLVETLFSLITAVCIIFIFWTIMDALQYPLDFEAQVSSTNITSSILGTAGILLPISIGDYLLKQKELVEARSMLLVEKAQKARSKIDDFEQLLKRIKKDTPVVIAPIETRALLLKEDIDRIISRSSAGLYSLSEIEEKIDDLDKNLIIELNNLSEEINRIMEEHYARAFHQHSLCINKLKDIGLETKSQTEIADTKKFQERDINSKINLFKKLLDAGYSLADEAVQLFEKIYDITRSLYDPRLPSNSPTIVIVKQKIEEKANPWEIIDAVCASLYNLEKQYSAEISRSIENLRDSLNSIINLTVHRESLVPVLGNSLPEILGYANKARSIQTSFETKELNVMKVVIVKEALDSILNISKNLLSIFYRELKRKEIMISDLLPMEGYDWGKNVSLSERMEEAIEVTSNPSRYDVSRLTSILYRSFSYFEECIGTLDLYNQQYEFLLNYVIAESIIDEFLRRQKHVYARELPFDPRYGKEYLRIYFRQRYAGLFFDEESTMIMKRG